MNGRFEQRESGAKPVVHVLEVRNDVVVKAYVYQVEGDTREPGFAGQWQGRYVTEAELCSAGFSKQ